MAQIICRDLAIGYEGKTVVQNINLSVKKGDYLCVDRGKWGWEIYFYEDFTGTFITGERENRIP